MLKPLKSISVEILFRTLFCIGSIVFFGICYYHHLYHREQLQLFQLTMTYLSEHLTSQGGLAVYLGEFFTQFFRIQFVGAIIITSFLIFLQQATKKILTRISGKEISAIISFIPSLGYWTLLTQQFYYFSGLIGLLISLIGTVYYVKIKNAKLRSVSGLLMIPVIYWLTGGAFLVFTSIVIITELLLLLNKHNEKSSGIHAGILAVYLAVAVLIPLFIRKFLVVDTILQSYLSEAYYAIRIFFPLPLILVFASVPALVLLQAIVSDKLSAKQVWTVNSLLFTAVTILFVAGLLVFPDFGREKEIIYENLAYNGKWEKIISKAEKEQPSSQSSLVIINLALAKRGQLSSKMFHFDQQENSLFLTYERKGMTPFAASEPFYHLGLVNFSQMFAMETVESTPDQIFPSRSFKRIAETFLINEQKANATKYLVYLSRTLFYSKWAKKQLDYLDADETLDKDKALRQKKELSPQYDFFYNHQQMDIALRYLLITNHENRLAFEYLMAYYLLKKDLDGFLQNIGLVNELKYDKLPLVYQEAIAYILTRLPETPPQLQNFTLDQAVINNIKAYANLFSTDRNDTLKLKKEFGKTYWFYLHYK